MRRAGLVLLLFALSGAVGLAYEVLWFRRFTHVWGSSGLALAAVLASFLGGLGLGAWLLGKLADTVRRPLLVYGLCELGIGLLALLVPLEIGWLAERSTALHSWLSTWPPVAAMGRLLVTFAVLGPPSVLLGGTLPLLLAFFGRDGSTLRRAAGGLYAANTIGASIGCFLTGFVLLPRLGLAATQQLAVATSLGVGVLAILADLVISRTRASNAPGEPSEPGVDADATTPELESATSDLALASPGRVALGSLAFLGGFASLVLEVVWTRQIAVTVGGSTYAFSAALSVFLLGIAAGGLVYHRALRRRGALRLVPVHVVLWIVATTLVGRALLPTLSDASGLAVPLRASMLLDASVSLLASAALEFAPSFGMGLLFPLVLHLAASAARRAASTLGRLYALNTIGSIVGAVATALWLLPRFGSVGATAIAIVAYAVILALLHPPLDSWRRSASLLVALTFVLVLAMVSAREGDPRETQLGQYLYGYIAANERPSEVLFFREGTHASVLVSTSPGGRSLRVNGKVDASTFGDMRTQLALAYAPLFVRPDARTACVIGFGSGTTVGALLLVPDLRATCVELEPAVVEAGEHFVSVNHDALASDRLRVVLDDGRSFLAGTPERFDLIVSEPSNPWLAGVSNLFTREFYALARDRLEPDGVLAQWIQCYAFELADYALVARTVRDVFPHAMLVRVSAEDTVLLASGAPIAPSAASCDRAQEIVDGSAELQADLLGHLGTRDVRAFLLGHVLLDTRGVDRFLSFDAGVDLHVDLDPRLEFDAPRRLYSRRAGDATVDLRLLDAVREGFHGELARAMGATPECAAALHELWRVLGSRSSATVTCAIVEAGLAIDGESVELLADLLISLPLDDASGTPESSSGGGASDAPAQDGERTHESRFAAAFARLVSNESVESSMALARAGKDLFAANHDARAERVLRELVRRHPGSATAWTNLANTLSALRRGDEAREALDEALRLDPLSAFARESSRAKVPDESRDE